MRKPKRSTRAIRTSATSPVPRSPRWWNPDATTDFSPFQEMDTINICAPIPLRKTNDSDMSYIASACQEIAGFFHAGMLASNAQKMHLDLVEECFQFSAESPISMKRTRSFPKGSIWLVVALLLLCCSYATRNA